MKKHKDNDERKYGDFGFLESYLEEVIESKRDEWRTPYYTYEDNDGVLHKIDYEPQTIREKLALNDAFFRKRLYKNVYYTFRNWCTKVRVPSLKRSIKEWENFYRTFPYIAVKVATGEERFCDGAKLKYIPLFKEILDRVWPEDMGRWTETQYEILLRAGKIKK